MQELKVPEVDVERWTINGLGDDGHKFEMGASSVEEAIKILKQLNQEGVVDIRCKGAGKYPGETYGIQLGDNGKAIVIGPKGQVIYKEGLKMNKYKILAEAIALGRLKHVDVSTSRINARKLTVDEIKEYIVEEFGKAKNAADIKAKENEKGWGDAEIAKEIEWVKALDLCEFFDIKKRK
jgi:hypothetical protein